MRRIVAGCAVLLLFSVGTPAGGQTGRPWWTPEAPTLEESAGEVVLMLSVWRPGRVIYRTMDGHCSQVNAVSSTATCRGPMARASEDYTAVQGEVVFTEGGTRTIRIPILNDGLVEERYESFTVATWEDPPADPFSGDTAVVRITDDDDLSTTGEPAVPAPGGQTTAAAAPEPAGELEQSAATDVKVASRPAASTPSSVSPGDVLERAGEDLRRGPGFELTGGGAPEAPRHEEGGLSGAAVALGLSSAALGVGTLVLVRRRRQWSPTQS